MSRPKAYDPEHGYMYQLLCRHPEYNGREWEHCDYAKDRKDKDYLLKEYRMSYGSDWRFRTMLLPQKYWPKPKARTHQYCNRCGTEVEKETIVTEYPYYCPVCDENMYTFEVRPNKED